MNKDAAQKLRGGNLRKSNAFGLLLVLSGRRAETLHRANTARMYGSSEAGWIAACRRHDAQRTCYIGTVC